MLSIILFALCGFSLTAGWVKEMENRGLYEGDMILTHAQKSAISRGLDPSLVHGRASVNKNLWPGAVLPYTIDRSLANDARGMAAIRAGMKLWTDSTCIRFKPRTNERNYAHFYIGGGCSSYVGVSGGRQMISLARGCWHASIVSHEIGHCLGFYHEQSRPDRDNYVQIIWSNIPSGVRFNFNKMTVSQIDSLGTPYDYASVMHYERTAFGSGRETIRPKKAGVTLGNKRGPTAIDIKQMNLLYKCSGGGGGGGGGGTVKPPQPTRPPTCADKDNRCSGWSSYCNTNNYVKANCLKTCGRCGGSCADKDSRCRYWGSYCGKNNYVNANCKKTCRTC